MKALSLHPHWADRIRSGVKTIEIRTWPTKHRGELLICAAKGPNPDNLPTGVAICTVDLIDCCPMTKEDELAAGVAYDPSYYAWILRNPRPVPPTPIKGQQRLFDVVLSPIAAA